MLLNHLKIALRALLRNRVYSAINMFGLALGVAASLLLYVYVHHELSYDYFIPDNQNLYRVVTEIDERNQAPRFNTNVTTLLVKSAQGQLPGVASMTRINDSGETATRLDNEIYSVNTIAAEPSVFQTFGLQLTEGDPATALESVRSALVTQSFATAHFPGGSPLGQSLEIQIGSEYIPVQISGVLPDPPRNSTLDYELIFNFELIYSVMRESFTETWGMNWANTYIRLKPGIDPASIENAIEELILGLGVNKEDDSVDRHFLLQPIRETHIALHNPRNLPTDVNGTAIFILALIAAVILVIASINFTTLSIGRSTTRVVEVGIRKVLGADRRRLMRQFWVETGILSFGAMLFGLLLTELALPTFSNLTGRELSLQWNFSLLLVMLGVWMLLIFAAGSYPALVMSGFQPIQAFRGALQTGGKSRLRKVLVLLQFSLSIGLLAILFVMDSQLKYVATCDLGIAGAQTVEIPVENTDHTGDQIVERLRSRFVGETGIVGISGISSPFSNTWYRINWQEDSGERYENLFGNVVMDGALEVLGVPLLAGRDFEAGNPRDQHGETIIINQAFADKMGWDDPVGQVLPGSWEEPIEVIGLVPDFHFASMHNAIEPLMLMGSIGGIMGHEGGLGFSISNWYTVQSVVVRLAPGQISQTLARLEDAWPQLAPGYTFDPVFIDNTINGLYQDDRRWNSIVRYGSLVALIIAALGLVGLSTLEVAQRRKEIGIRKVLGASAARLVVMLARQMTLLVIGSAVLALPAAYVISNRWLEEFAYRISVGPFTLTLALLSVILVTWLTVGSLAWHAATRNPVDAIRHE